ncbi:MAG TPA: hypothetical protein VEA41_18395 [Salinarimonas sp.]|nr:hypothetical protein [Salinarimonas sp.]
MATDQDGATAITDTQLLNWFNEEYRTLQSRLFDVAPDYFENSRTFTLTSSNTWTIDVFIAKIRKIMRLEGSVYVPLPMASMLRAEPGEELAWRVRAAAFIDIHPATSAAGSYKMVYIPQATSLAAGGTIDLPDGADTYLVHKLSARVRARFEETDLVRTHSEWAKEAYEALVKLMARPVIGTPQTVVDVYGDY